MYVAESNKVDGASDGDYEDGTVKRSPRSKNSNKATGYPSPDAKQAFT